MNTSAKRKISKKIYWKAKLEEFEDEVPDIAEEFRINPEHADQEDDREIPDDDDDGMDILSATTPLSRKETAKMIATGKTAPLPLDEISDALSHVGYRIYRAWAL